MAELSVAVGSLELKNPVLAGSGEATSSFEGLLASLDAGAAAVVAKSTNESDAAKRQLEAAEYVLLDESWRPLPMGGAPRTASLLNRSGLVAEPFESWVEILALADAEARRRDAYVVGSLIIADLDEAVRMAKDMEAAGLRWLEVNVGAPHATEALPGAIQAAADAVRVGELVRPITAAVGIPVTVKLGADGDLSAAASAAFEAGAESVCMAGRPLAFLPDPQTRRPVLGTFGAIGGAWALPLTLRHIARTRMSLGPDRPLIGTNGARDGLDVARFLLAGARAVEMTSAVITNGPSILSEVLGQLEAYLDGQGVAASEIIGEATDNVMTYQEAGMEKSR